MKFIKHPKNPEKGFWIPDADTSAERKFSCLNAWDDDFLPLHQIEAQKAALAACKNFRVAFDLGAHVGYWSTQLAKKFSVVYAFEPVPEHVECLRMNLPNSFMISTSSPISRMAKGVVIHPVALGNEDGLVHVGGTPEYSVKARVIDGVNGSMPARRLDGFGYEESLPCIDFMKIDCEEYEYFVLLGGEKTIRKHKPVICIEQVKGREGWYGFKHGAALDLLKSWGYKELSCVKDHDYIMVNK